MEVFYDYLQDDGGVTGLNLHRYIASDDTVLNNIIGESLLEDTEEIDDLCKVIIKKFINLSNSDKYFKERYYGNAFLNNIEKIKNGKNWKKIEYNQKYGGCGASIRTVCIGLAFSGKKNREKLIETAIETSRITHNNTTGFLGGLATALFISYAVEKIPIKKWCFKLLKLLKSDIIDNYIKSTRDYENYIKDKDSFIDKWSRYIKYKFNDDIDNKIVIEKNLVHRMRIYNENFSSFPENMNPGAGGDDSVIIAYDCLIDCEKNWEKLIIYSMIHIGDSDSTGCIAGAFYGILYGFFKIPFNNLQNLEFSKTLNDTAKKLYIKYQKKNNY